MKLNFHGCTRAAGSALLSCVLIGGAALTVRTQMPAETPQPERPITDVQLLKDRVKQLEQTVDDLKKQIGQIEDTQKPTTAPGTAATTATNAAGNAAAVPPGQPVAVKANPDGESKFEIYGFAMLDTGYDFNTNNPDWYDVIRPTKLPSFGVTRLP